MNANTTRSIVLLSVLLVGYLVIPVTAQSLSGTITLVHPFSAGDHVSADFESSGQVDIFGIVGVKGEITAGFFVGVDLPAELRIVYPEWVNQGSDSELLFNAEGLPGGRVGLEVHAGLKVRFYFLGGLATIGVIDVDEELDLAAEMTTPIGSSVVIKPLEAKVKIGTVTIPLILTSVKVSVYFGVTASVEVAGSLLSDLLVESSSLLSNIRETLLWDDENETIVREFSVAESAEEDILLSLSQTRLKLDRYSIVINSVFFELETAGFTLPRLVLPIPFGFSIPVASGAELDCPSPSQIIIHVFIPDSSIQINSGTIIIVVALTVGVLFALVIFTRRG